MTSLFNRHGVSHPYLPENKFSIWFNVANLGNSLDDLRVNVSGGVMKLGAVISINA